ncbi:MAG TPA: hypothetical protein VEK37_07755 [Gemmatimonadaceae bacterium]|nr:hypothetical protein [Gemmatimonadaceae bacterium]
MKRDLISQIAAVDVSQYPNVHDYEDEIDALLWVLKVAADSGVAPTLSAAEVAELLVDAYRRDMTRQRAAALLARGGGLVAEKRVKGELTYLLLKKGVDRLLLNGGGVLVVDPEQAYSALQRLDKILGSLKGEVLLCDPYVSDRTLAQLTSIPRACQIKLLTMKVSDAAQFRIKRQAYDAQYGNLEIRVDSAGTIHDRYIVDDAAMWSLGTSLNHIGKKQSIIVNLGPDLRTAIKAAFMARWNTAKTWT